MRVIVVLVSLLAAGFVVAFGLKAAGVDAVAPPGVLINLLLGVGLYAAATGIDFQVARRDARLILMAISLGVLLKAALIGVPLWLLTGTSLWLLRGMVVAQIDPLSVTALEKSSRMSDRAKRVLLAWATFDDPMTVLLAIYLLPPIVVAFGGPANLAELGGGLDQYGFVLAGNLVLASVVFVLWRLAKLLAPKYRQAAKWMLLALALGFAMFSGFMLGIALVGLFLRPATDQLVNRVVTGAYWVATFLAGMLLVNGIDWLGALTLGVAAYVAHAVVSELLTRAHGLTRRDRAHLRLGQQNGITAINLALLFAAFIPQFTAIVAPAIVVVNVLHAVSNALLARLEGRAEVKLAASKA